MNRSLLERVPLPALAIAGAIAWTVSGMLFATQVDTDPVGAHYDAYNRIYTAAIALLLVGALAVRARLVRAGVSRGRRAIAALAVGFGLVLAGNLLEFWGALIAGVQSSAAAEASGGEGFWGSDPGWAAVLLGAVVVVVAAVALGRAAGGWPRVTMRARVAIGAAGPLWALSLNPPVAPAVAAVPALLFGFAWLTLALTCERLQEQTVPSTPRRRASRRSAEASRGRLGAREPAPQAQSHEPVPQRNVSLVSPPNRWRHTGFDRLSGAKPVDYEVDADTPE